MFNGLMNLPTEGELNSYQIIAKMAANNPHWRKLGGGGDAESVIAQIFSLMLLAREIGISPMMALGGDFNNINGKFEISARLMNKLIRRNGNQIKIVISNDEMCKIWAKRADTGEEHTEAYSMEDAKMASLIRPGSGWTKNPTDMLFARCISRMGRRLFPDCIGPFYIEGELKETMLKQPAIVEVPEDVKLEFKQEQEIVTLNLPEGISAALVEEYLTESAGKRHSIDELKKRAAANMEGFMKVFNKWLEIKKLKDLPIDDSFDIEALESMAV